MATRAAALCLLLGLLCAGAVQATTLTPTVWPSQYGQIVPKSQVQEMRPLDCPAGYRDAKPRTSDDDYQLLSTALAAQARLSASKLCGTGGKVDTASLGLSKLNGCISKPPAAAWVMAEATVEYECKDGKHGTVGLIMDGPYKWS